MIKTNPQDVEWKKRLSLELSKRLYEFKEKKNETGNHK